MAGDTNVVVLAGRVTRDAELRYTSAGTAKSEFSIAVNRRIKKGDKWEDEASFFNLTLWDKRGETLNKFLVKGAQVIVRGQLKQDRWEKDGQKQSKIAVMVDDIQLVGGNGRNESSSGGGHESRPQQSAEDDFDPAEYEDSIPF